MVCSAYSSNIRWYASLASSVIGSLHRGQNPWVQSCSISAREVLCPSIQAMVWCFGSFSWLSWSSNHAESLSAILSLFSFILYPLFVRGICCHLCESDDTWSFVFVRGFYSGFYYFPVLGASLVDCHDFFTFGESPFPPEDTLHRIVVHTGNKTLVEEFSTHSDSLRFGWMGDVDEEEGHRS